MRRIFAFVLAIFVITVPVCANISFYDIDNSHWAFEFISKLVNDGTVKGYQDGSFRPDNTVTRAEFVKMIGCGPERRSDDFDDVQKTHWGYEYIITSGFEISGNNFYPDKNITRGETIELLWKRNGKKIGLTAPKVITDQYKTNKDAVSWAYNYKVLIGDDGLNLRLEDTLSRAEAATLIIRSREIDFNAPQSDFKDIVSHDTLKTFFESYNLFDDGREYTPDATITNGEMARAALRLADDEFNLLYNSYVVNSTFEHEYAKDVTIISDRCIKKDSATLEFTNALANVENTIAAFSFAALQKTNNLISYGNINNTYTDVSKDIESRKNVLLTFAYENGLFLRADGSIGALNNITHKDIAALLIQLDDLIGMETAFSTETDSKGKNVVKDVKLNKDITSYPFNYSDYACIIEGIPNFVYEKEISGLKPFESYNFSREYAEIFVAKLESLVSYIKSTYSVDAELVMYPDLVWDNGKNFVLRLQCNILNASKDVTASEVFGDSLIMYADDFLKAGQTYFIEITLKHTDLFM